MANDIKYLDQKGLKTFHDATGWVTIKLDKGQSIKHHTHSPVKFHSNGKVYINGVQKTIVPIAEEMLWPDTIIKNDDSDNSTPMTISVFVNEYNQLIQDDFKTDKLTLPGSDEQVVLGNGSLKELNNLVVGNAENADKLKTIKSTAPIYLLGTTNSSEDTYTTIYKNPNISIEADGLTLKVPKLSITKGGLSITEGGLSITEGVTTDILLGNGQPIAKSDLINELLKILLSNGNEEIIATASDIEEIFNITNNNTNI